MRDLPWPRELEVAKRRAAKGKRADRGPSSLGHGPPHGGSVRAARSLPASDRSRLREQSEEEARRVRLGAKGPRGEGPRQRRGDHRVEPHGR